MDVCVTAMNRIEAETSLTLSKAKVCSVPVLTQDQYGSVMSLPLFQQRLAACKTKQERLEVCYDALAHEGYLGGVKDDPTVEAWRDKRNGRA